MCVFSSAREAIRAALDLQHRFVEETLAQPEFPLTVGIGLDAGEAVPVQGGYRGGALNLAARLCGQARAGEILGSRDVTHLARRLDGVHYQDRGSITFKGISDPVVVVRVVPEGADPAERLRPFASGPPAEQKPTRRWAVLGAIVLGLALVAISIPLLSSGDDASEIDIGANSIGRLNAEDGSLELATEFGQRPGASAVGFGSLWVAQPDRGVVARLRLDDGSVIDPSIRVGNSPAGVAVGEGSVWVTNAADGTVSRINVETNEASQTLAAGTGPTGIAFGDGALWVADTVGAALLRVDPISGESESVPLAGQPSGVAFTNDAVWVSVAPAGVARVDPADLSVTLTKTVGSGPTAIVAAFGSIWVANNLDGTVSRLDPSTGDVRAMIPVGEGPIALVAAGGSLWVANGFDDSISTIDAVTNTSDPPVPVGGAPGSLAAQGEALWLAVGASATEHLGGTLTVSSESEAPVSLDPAVVYGSGWELLSITNDTLVTYKKVSGPDGATLVPDLASSLPQVSEDGLSYRFPFREGVSYSTGDPVRPEDIRHGLERAIALSLDAAEVFGAIDGADACHQEPSSCDLSDSIVGDDESVTIHLARPDGDLPFKLALPLASAVPTTIPVEDQGLDPVPATGPYMIAEADSGGIELVRNPEFQEWSGAAQPDGFVDAISWRFLEGRTSAFDRLNAGEVDLMTDTPTPEDLANLQAAHPDQVVLASQYFTVYVGFDVLQPPFDDPRVRQALNYAIDRERVVELLGGPTMQRPTCQILPPNYQGYVPFCPYTLEPESGVWSAPDPDRAHALIDETDAVGEEVTVWVMDHDPILGDAAPVMRHVVDVLNDLGLRAHLKVVPLDPYFAAVNQHTAKAGTPGHPQVFLYGWIQDWPAAGNFIVPLFSCDVVNPFGYCSRSLDARVDKALGLQATDPGAADRLWTDIEHRLVEDAALAPLTNPIFTRAVSARVENVQVHPQWGILFSRLWVQ